MFEKTLVCLDGSKLAEQILPYAAQQALRFGSKMTLLRVMTMPSSAYMGTEGVSAGIIDLIEDEVRRQEPEIEAYLERMAGPLRKRGIDVNCTILRPAPAGHAILGYARDKSIDLICVATHGRSGLGRTVFGSVADFLLRESGLPSLIYRPQESETEAAVEPQPIKRILACLDGSELAGQIMPYATEEALSFQARLILLQVVPEPVILLPGIPGVEPVPIRTDVMIEETKRSLARAKEYLERVATRPRERGIEVETVAILGRAGETILNYASSNDVDLIAIVTHGRSGLGRAVFGSIANHVLRHSGVPVLVIRPKSASTVGTGEPT
ncbi:MAG: universal stress protein [Dehalococcoidia bacterium]|nr:universal stress protein [Dehalococcoidia bacterium]